MPLPIFPTEEGVPGDGNLIAVYGGGSTEVIGGIVQFLQAVEMHPLVGVLTLVPTLQKGQPVTNDGVTVWLQGSLLLDVRGQPTVEDYADMLDRWDAVRAKLLLADYELFMYYRTASPATYRKLKTVNTYMLKAYWDNPVCLSYLLLAVTSDTTLYDTEPGA